MDYLWPCLFDAWIDDADDDALAPPVIECMGAAASNPEHPENSEQLGLTHEGLDHRTMYPCHFFPSLENFKTRFFFRCARSWVIDDVLAPEAAVSQLFPCHQETS